jgi:zona occludens toxin (predicted ATPase)
MKLYSGTPGSGKSFHVMEDILFYLHKGLRVIANFNVLFSEKEIKKGYAERFTYWDNEEFTVANLCVFSVKNKMFQKKKEDQCLVVIDEAGGRFNPRDFGKKDRREWIDWVSQHMKFGYNMILIAQHDRMLDRQIRTIIETEVVHRKVNRFKWFRWIPFITVFVYVEHWYAAKNVKVGSDFFLYRKKIADKYDRFKIFSGFTFTAEMLKLLEENLEEGEKEIPAALNVNIGAIYADDRVPEE